MHVSWDLKNSKYEHAWLKTHGLGVQNYQSGKKCNIKMQDHTQANRSFKLFPVNELTNFF